MLTNYHTHTFFSDGNGSFEEYIQTALEKGFRVLGFSDHSPVTYPADEWTMSAGRLREYIDCLKGLKNEAPEALEIYAGLELDYISEDPGAFILSPDIAELDYRIGSVHTMGDVVTGNFFAVDGPKDQIKTLVENCFRGDVYALTAGYYSRMEQMTALGGFEILGHLDLIKKHNGKAVFFDEENARYRSQVLSLLDRLEQGNLIIEVNTGGLARGATDEVYPSPWILKELLRRGIPVHINADAHLPGHLDFAFDRARELLRSLGFRSQRHLFQGVWQDLPL